MLAGYVDADGDPTPTTTVTTTAGNTTARAVHARPGGPGDGALRDHDRRHDLHGPVRAVGLVVQQRDGGGINRFYHAEPADDVITTPQDAVPVLRHARRANYADNYNVWAGKCMAAQPPAGAFRRTATVAPGATWAMNGTTGPTRGSRCRGWSSGSPTTGAPVKPTHIKLTDSCGQIWQPRDRSPPSTVPTTGWLALPGPALRHLLDLRRLPVPGTGQHDPSNFRKVTLTAAPNTDFTDGELDHGRDHRAPRPRGSADERARLARAAIRADESGFTLIELLVVCMVSIVVVLALFAFQDVALREIQPRVREGRRDPAGADDDGARSRPACGRAASSENVTPIQAGQHRHQPRFLSKYGSAASLDPGDARDRAEHATGVLTDTTYPVTGGTSPNWTFSSDRDQTRTLLDHVTQVGRDPDLPLLPLRDRRATPPATPTWTRPGTRT